MTKAKAGQVRWSKTVSYLILGPRLPRQTETGAYILYVYCLTNKKYCWYNESNLLKLDLL